LEGHFPQLDKIIAVGFLAKIPRYFGWIRGCNRKSFGVFVSIMMKSPSEFARAFPEFNGIGFIRREKCTQFAEYSSRVDLVRMGSTVEYFLGHMNRVGYNDDFRDIIDGA